MASPAVPITERISAEFEAAQGVAPAPQAAELTQRRAALQAALAAGLPGQRDEGFRYAQLRPLDRLKFTALTPGAGANPAIAEAEALLPRPLPGFARVVYVDGQLCTALCSESVRKLGDMAAVEFAGVRLAHARPSGEAVAAVVPAERRFALINAAFATDTLRIDVRASAGPARIELLFVALTDGAAGASYPRIVVDVTAGSQLELVERQLGTGDAATFTNASAELRLARGAHCRHYRLQSLGTRAMHIETLQATLDADAHYALQLLHAGAGSMRSTIDVELAGAGGRIDVHGAQVAGGTQVQDTQLTIEHRGAATTTSETFRGIGSGRARIAFNGHMIVRETARGASTQQSLRGLLAGPETEADLRPQLEIYTDDVRASHGATAGKLDENMLFYLLSRGIDRGTAQNLLKWAFMAEVITQIPIAQLREDAQQLVLGRVQGLIGEALS